MKKLKLSIVAFLIGTSVFAQCAAHFTFTVDTTTYTGSVTFTNTSTGGLAGSTNYYWNFGDGTSAYTTSPNHTFANGTWYVCLTMMDSSTSCTSSFCDSVTVINNSLPTCNAAFTYYDSAGNTTFTALYPDTTLTYNWSFGDGTNSSSVGSVIHHYNSNGIYYACLTVSNSLLGCSNTYCDSLMISNGTSGGGTCTASFYSINDSIGNGVSFYSSVSGTANTYYWTFGDGNNSASANPYHVYSTGTYTVCLNVTSSTDTACHYHTCQSILIGPNNSCNAYFTVSVDSSNTALIYNYSIGSGLTYAWSYGDGTTGNTPAFYSTHHYASAGTYHICLTITNSFLTCTSTFCDTINITNCYAGFTYVADTASNGVTFTSTSSGTQNTYHWTFGDGTSSSSQNPYHVYSAAGSYTACLTISSTVDTTCNNTICQNITAGIVCNAMFYVIHDTVNIYNYNVYNYASSNGTIISYLWDFGDGTTSTLPYPSHTYANSTPVLLCLTITSGNGCTATHCDSINPGHSVNHATTLNVHPATTTGITEHTINTEMLSNYPNPFSDITTIEYTLTQNSAIELSVFDLLGNKIAVIENGNKSSGNYKMNFDGTSISSGIYLLQLKLENKVITKKLVIAK